MWRSWKGEGSMNLKIKIMLAVQIPKVPDEVQPKFKGNYKSYEDITYMYYKYALAASFDVRKMTNKKMCMWNIIMNLCLKISCFLDTIDSLIHGKNRSLSIFLLRMLVPPKCTCSLLLLMVDTILLEARDLNCFISGTNAHMLVDKMTNGTKNVPNFSFDFRVENKQLNAIFWTDKTSQINYKEFGDVVSFDATFRSNRYDMVFVPFIGIDNHKKLCMWHITSKLPSKVSLDIVNYEEFNLQFNSLIWNSKLEEKDFEHGW
uniref:Protein FAR1-RELATED SEQUENCE n=1 Tax=Lactuca sativa TaxID=4236 RepID=A0A9R1X7V5_LACSA|nr:hypothetical protein LSAT_V11C600317850 [Lactuca sativa]